MAHRVLATLSDVAVCVDVGAHDGSWLAQFRKYCPGGQHVGFEPLPHLIPDLRERFPNCKIHQMAIADSNGPAQFQHVLNDPTWSGLNRQRYFFTPDIETIQVDVRRLDDVLSSASRIEFIKITAQGVELEVLTGARLTLSKFKPILYLEHAISNLCDHGRTSTSLFELLSNSGYSLFSLESEVVLNCDEFLQTIEYAHALHYKYPAETNFIATTASQLPAAKDFQPEAAGLATSGSAANTMLNRSAWAANKRTFVKASHLHSSLLDVSDKFAVVEGATIAGSGEIRGDHIALRGVTLDGKPLPASLYFIYSADWVPI